MTKKFQYTDIDGILKEAEAFIASEFISTSSGVVDAGKPVITNASGVIDPSLVSSTAQKAATLVIDRLAHEDILRGDVLYAVAESKVAIASYNDVDPDKAFVLGVALNDALPGEPVEVLLAGVISDALFGGFSVQDKLFLEEDGAITNVKTSTRVAVIGKALGNNEILIDIEPLIILGG